MRLLEIPDALRRFGLEPVEVAGWRTRGLEFEARPIIHLRHWTAGARTGRAPSLGTVTNGRPDLPGPLCQVMQERTAGTNGPDRVYVVASGRANHAGAGLWAGVDSGNRRGTGNEIEWSGPGEPFGTARRETSERVAAALLSLSRDPNGRYACEHREYALPAGRKQDTNLSGGVMRAKAHALLAAAAPAPPDPGDDDMGTPQYLVKKAGDPRWWVTDGIFSRHVDERVEAKILVNSGLATSDGLDAAGDPVPFVWPDLIVDDLKDVATL